MTKISVYDKNGKKVCEIFPDEESEEDLKMQIEHQLYAHRTLIYEEVI